MKHFVTKKMRETLRTLTMMPFAQTVHLAWFSDADLSTINRQMHLLQQSGSVYSIRPSLGSQVRDSWYLTPFGTMAYLNTDVRQGVQLSRSLHHDPLDLMRLIPRLPQRIALYDTVCDVDRAAITHFRRIYGNELGFRARFVFDETFDYSKRGINYAIPFDAMYGLDVIYSDKHSEYYVVLIVQDDGLSDERAIGHFISRLRKYRQDVHRTALPPILIRCCDMPRALMWISVVKQQIYEDWEIEGVVQVGQSMWPLSFGNAPAWDRDWTPEVRDISSGALTKLDTLFAGYTIDDYIPRQLLRGPSLPAAIIPAHDKILFAPDFKKKPLDEHMTKLLDTNTKYINDVIPAQMALSLSYRHLRLLMLIATSPLISFDDLCLYLQLQPSSLEQMVRDLRREGLAEQIDIENQIGIPALTSGMQSQVRVARITPMGLDYLEIVYGKELPVWHRNRRFPLIHDTGVLRFFALMHRDTMKQNDSSSLWWRVGTANVLSLQSNYARFRIYPDGNGILYLNTAQWHFMLEWDQAQEHEAQLRKKFDRYQMYTKHLRDLYYNIPKDAREYRPDNATIGTLLIVTATKAQEQRILNIGRDWANSTSYSSEHLRVFLTTFHQLAAHSPFANIWTQMIPKQAVRKNIFA